MPSALPKRDVSLTWLRCGRPGCGASHVPEVDCPPRGVWLVEHFRAIRSPAATPTGPRRRAPR